MNAEQRQNARLRGSRDKRVVSVLKRGGGGGENECFTSTSLAADNDDNWKEE